MDLFPGKGHALPRIHGSDIAFHHRLVLPDGIRRHTALPHTIHNLVNQRFELRVGTEDEQVRTTGDLALIICMRAEVSLILLAVTTFIFHGCRLKADSE